MNPRIRRRPVQCKSQSRTAFHPVTMPGSALPPLAEDQAEKAAVLGRYGTDSMFADFRPFGFAAALKKWFHIEAFKTLVGLLLADCFSLDENGVLQRHRK